jgi:crotonobetainyl-CoA:carnitine CoA-transferase CaiB-like acyl-CoA transferase
MTTLEDLRVLDLSEGFAGAYCAALFAGYGADVIGIEAPSGNPLREHGEWERLGAGKRGVTLDVRTATGRALFLGMVEQANVVIETSPHAETEMLGLGFADLYGVKRRIILTSFPEYSSGGSNEALVAGLNAFAATAIAAHNADAYEVPQHIEVSIAECIAASSDGSAAVPGDAPFLMSEVEWAAGSVPSPGEHNAEFYGEALGLSPRDLVRLRAAGVI